MPTRRLDKRMQNLCLLNSIQDKTLPIIFSNELTLQIKTSTNEDSLKIPRSKNAGQFIQQLFAEVHAEIYFQYL